MGGFLTQWGWHGTLKPAPLALENRGNLRRKVI